MDGNMELSGGKVWGTIVGRVLMLMEVFESDQIFDCGSPFVKIYHDTI